MKQKEPLNIEYVNIDLLVPYINNAKKHPQQQIDQIAASIKEFSMLDPIGVDKDNGIIEGHGRYLACQKLGFKEVPVIRLNNLTPAQKKAYIITHNKLTLNSDFDTDLLKIEFESLKEDNFNLNITGFSLDELSTIGNMDLGDNTPAPENTYTSKIKIPVYEPRGEKPEIKELFDTTKFNVLIKEIEQNKELKEEEKHFLRFAAYRHVVFNYENIAEYYCHSSKETQNLFENSALVLIDFDKAIEQGFISMTKDLSEVYDNEPE